jgi:hypothetical protein
MVITNGHHSQGVGSGSFKWDLRYETTNKRRLVYAINQLERLQRARKRGACTGTRERSGLKRSIVFCKGQSAIGTGAQDGSPPEEARTKTGYEVDPKPSKTGVLQNEATKSFVMSSRR